MTSLRALARDLLPPAIHRVLRKHSLIPGAITFKGDYPDWPSAAASCTGYDDEAILETVRAAALCVKRGESAYERDSVLFDRIQYSWPLLASLLLVAARRAGAPLRVVDFGGSLGTTFHQNRRFLECVPGGVAWRIVEQPHFVAAGNRDFSDAVLTFHESIGEAAAGGVDAVVLGGVINYVADPAAVMRAIGEAAPGYLIIDRTIVIEGARDVIGVQTVPASIHRARYPVRKLSRASLGTLLEGWSVIEEWVCELQPDPASTSYGYFCRRA